MYRLVIAVIALLLAAGCGGEEGATDEVAQQEESSREPAAGVEVPSESGREAIPEAIPEDAAEGVALTVYADSLRETTELAVSVGDIFFVYMFAEIDVPIRVSAVQYRLVLPDGITVIGEEKSHEKTLSFGDRTSLGAVGLGCRESGKYWLLMFTCRVEEGFKGGELRTAAGINPDGSGFLGFVACEDLDYRKIPASPGTLILRLE